MCCCSRKGLASRRIIIRRFAHVLIVSASQDYFVNLNFHTKPCKLFAHTRWTGTILFLNFSRKLFEISTYAYFISHFFQSIKVLIAKPYDTRGKTLSNLTTSSNTVYILPHSKFSLYEKRLICTKLLKFLLSV